MKASEGPVASRWPGGHCGLPGTTECGAGQPEAEVKFSEVHRRARRAAETPFKAQGGGPLGRRAHRLPVWH
eukprot:767573-Hanusia_phi.AAC.3